MPALKVLILNHKTFLIYKGFGQLSSSNYWQFKAIQNMGVIHPRLVFVGAEIFTKF